MGIGGSGASGVAKLAQKLGYEVDGCDLSGPSTYNENVIKGHSPSHVQGVDLVVTVPAVFYQNKNHPELLRARREGKLLTWQEFLGKHLHKGKSVICVAGTHGKSTTTAMATKLLEDAGLDPMAVVGAKVPSWGGSARYGKGKYFITEADEFFNNYLNYSPEIIILNNIEFDHPDFFKNASEVFKSFKEFIGKLKGKKLLITNGDDRGVRRLLSTINTRNVKLIKYSAKAEGNLDLNLRVVGEHNKQNALGVVALGRFLGIADSLIKKSLESFVGIGRRLELIFDREGVSVFDDYAHHPTAIEATLEALRQKFPNRRIWAIVEPHGYKRTKALLGKYKGIFKDASKVIIGPIFKARDRAINQITPQLISKTAAHWDSLGVDSFDQIRRLVKKEIQKGDIFLVMGAGRSYLWSKNLLKI